MADIDASATRDHGPHRLEVLARLLMRAEAVGSSRIEGLVVSPRKLALADFDPELDPSGRALEIVGNLRASSALSRTGSGGTRRSTRSSSPRHTSCCRSFSRIVDALTRTRKKSPGGGQEEAHGWSGWIELAAEAARVACSEAHAYESRVDALLHSWRQRIATKLGAPRSDAALWALLDFLPAAPLITARSAVELTGRSARAIDGAIAQLVGAGLLEQVAGRVRYRLYEAVGVFDIVAESERALASPDRDTLRSPPVRPVPARRRKVRG